MREFASKKLSALSASVFATKSFQNKETNNYLNSKEWSPKGAVQKPRPTKTRTIGAILLAIISYILSSVS